VPHKGKWNCVGRMGRHPRCELSVEGLYDEKDDCLASCSPFPQELTSLIAHFADTKEAASLAAASRHPRAIIQPSLTRQQALHTVANMGDASRAVIEEKLERFIDEVRRGTPRPSSVNEVWRFAGLALLLSPQMAVHLMWALLSRGLLATQQKFRMSVATAVLNYIFNNQQHGRGMNCAFLSALMSLGFFSWSPPASAWTRTGAQTRPQGWQDQESRDFMDKQYEIIQLLTLYTHSFLPNNLRLLPDEEGEENWSNCITELDAIMAENVNKYVHFSARHPAYGHFTPGWAYGIELKDHLPSLFEPREDKQEASQSAQTNERRLFGQTLFSELLQTLPYSDLRSILEWKQDEPTHNGEWKHEQPTYHKYLHNLLSAPGFSWATPAAVEAILSTDAATEAAMRIPEIWTAIESSPLYLLLSNE